MKRILYSIWVGTLALSLTAAFGEENQPGRDKSKPTGATRSTHVSSRTTLRSSGHVFGGPASVRTYRTTPKSVSRATYRSNYARMNSGTKVTSNRVRNNVTVNRERNFTNRNNVTVNRDRNFTARNNTVVNHNRNARVNNNWRGARFNGRAYTAFRDYHRQWHDRFWWRSHFNRIVFVSGGWYYWNAGYWFPAWGYDPYYSYPYDGPTYGYNGLAPDQVIVDVQSQLQRDGYYNGPVDGVLGPNTRAAIASFQADHGLAITSAVDEPTLDSLGIS